MESFSFAKDGLIGCQTTFDGIAPQIAAIQAESERMEENRVPIKHKLEGQTKKLHQGQKDLADIEVCH